MKDCKYSLPKKLKILWLIDLNYKVGFRHGGNLRFFNFSKELIFKGHEVYFIFNKSETDNLKKKNIFLQYLKDNKFITDYFETDYKFPRFLKRIIYFHPVIANKLQEKIQKSFKDTIIEIIKNRKINIFIISYRPSLFILPEIQGLCKIIIDWTDSMVLYEIRQISVYLRKYKITEVFKSLLFLIHAFIEENYYGKFCNINMIVSPIDKKYLDYINKEPKKNKVLLNGVKMNSITNKVTKIKSRLIFTGNMSFPPNYNAAIWFIDNILPLIRRHKNDIKLVIAGQNPNDELLSRRSNYIEITGYVKDISQEIAKSELYVAPLISGGGFKNKVVEAIASGTFVVATNKAVEFFNSNIKKYMLIANRPNEFANTVLYCLNNPQEIDTRLNSLQDIINEEFKWENRTDELIKLAYEIL